MTVNDEGNHGAAEIAGAMRQELQAFVSRRVPEADAEDIVQEVLARVVDRGATLRDDERMLGWVYRVARNAVTDYYRRRGRGRERLAANADEVSSRPNSALLASEQAASATELAELESAAQRDELSACLRPFVERLDEKYKTALSLVELQGLSQAEAAERVGISVSGMKSRVQRGRDLLKAELLRCCGIELDGRGTPIGYEPRPSSSACCGSNCSTPGHSTAVRDRR